MTIYAAAPILADHGHMHGFGGFGGWWIPIVLVGMILFCALMMVGMRAMMGMGGGRGAGSREEEKTSAMQVLERRLAEGDLTVEEYRERRAVLTGRHDAES